MKKYLPFILFGIGIIVALGAIVFVANRKDTSEEVEEEEQLITVPLESRPIASLTPRSDGHWLDMKIEKLGGFPAQTLDYELLYTLPDGRTQGVPGTVELEGKQNAEAELLLGSESSGKFRYDEGVDGGTLSLKFRNDKGKVVARFMTKFTMMSDTEKLISADEVLTLEMEESPDDFYVVMETFGVPQKPNGEVASGPYGIFTSAETVEGKLTLSKGSPKVWTGNEWSDTGALTSSSFIIGE